MILADDLPTPERPTTVHVVPVKVAEQVMAGVQRQLSAREAEMDAVMRAVADAERRAEVAVGEGERFLAFADHLLDQAQQLRVRPALTASISGPPPGDLAEPPENDLASAPERPAGTGDSARRVLHLRTAAPPPDTIA